MRKKICLLLTAIVLLSLCACSAGKKLKESTEYYWRVELKSIFPLGMDAEIAGVTATGNQIFVGGNSDGKGKIAITEYEVSDDGLKLGNSTELELSLYSEETSLLSLSIGTGRLYALFCNEDDTEGKNLPSYSIAVFEFDGSSVDSFQISLGENVTPQGMLILDDGRICLWSLHNIWLYSDRGKLIASLSNDALDFGPPLLIDGKLIIQTANFNSNSSCLNTFDFREEKLLPLAIEDEVNYAYSISQSAEGNVLINDGTEVIKISPDFQTETVLEWYDLTGKYGQSYRHLCQLDSDNYLMSSKGSGELICLSRDYRPDTRKTVHIGFYGQASTMLNELKGQYNHYNPDYKVECIDYGSDEQGLSQLMLDIGSGDNLDIVVSDGVQLTSTSAFIDLYPFIDSDPELNRDDFTPWLLENLEYKGELRQIWGSFSIYSMEARGPLAQGPEPLKLKDCQTYLDRIGYDGLLFDNYLTKEMLLNQIVGAMIYHVYDAETDSYRLDDPYVKELMELCNLQPHDFQFSENGATDSVVVQSEVLLFFDMQMDHLEMINMRDQVGVPHRFFDGSNGGDNFTFVTCDNRSCYMIPKTCTNKESAWGFLRTLLKSDWQAAYFEERRIGYPSNVTALEAVLNANGSKKTQAEFYRLLDDAIFFDYHRNQLCHIFTNEMQPYFNGDCTLDEAIDKAQSKINIYNAEHSA